MNHPAHAPTNIHRDDGRRLASVNDDNARVFLVMLAPDGYSGREACWLMSPRETRDIIAAMQGRLDRIEAREREAASAA